MATIGLCSCGQSNKSKLNPVTPDKKTTDTVIIDENKTITKTFSFESYVHTETDYTDATRKGTIIQNSYPRGGGRIYTSNESLQYGHAVFWTRIVNKTENPIELNIHFPADSFVMYPSPHTHFKLLVPQDYMTFDKVSTFSFGFEGVGAFVENNFYQPSQLQRTIPPNKATMFYVVLLSHIAGTDEGIGRTGLFLKEEALFYKLTVNPSISKLMPCGQITFKPDK